MEILAHQISNHVKRNYSIPQEIKNVLGSCYDIRILLYFKKYNISNIEKDITIIVFISNNVTKHRSLKLMKFNLLLYLTEK